MPSTLVQYRQLVEQVFRRNLKAGPDGVFQLFTHSGHVDSEEVVKRYAISAPCVILAPMGLTSIMPTGGLSNAYLQYAAYVITKNRASLDRNDLALAVVEAIARFLPFLAKDMSELPFKAPEDMSADNLNSQDTDRMALCLWVVKWKQRVQFTLDDYDSLDDLLRVHADYQLNESEEIESEQTIEVPGP